MSQRNQDRPADENLGSVTSEHQPRWIVSIDERSQGQGWVLEIDSPHAYLTVEVADLYVLGRAIGLLKLALAAETLGASRSFIPNRDDIALGYFGDSKVHLLRDNEDFPRCFILVQPNAECALRLTIEAGGIRAFMMALSRALADYPEVEKPSGEEKGTP